MLSATRINFPARPFVKTFAMSSSSSSNVVGVHYRVGKKIGEGSFGVIFEGTNLLNNQQVAIKFVSSLVAWRPCSARSLSSRLMLLGAGTEEK